MNHYKGKTSINEVLEMPNRLFHTLYVKLMNRLSTDEGAKQAAVEQVQEHIEEVGV